MMDAIPAVPRPRGFPDRIGEEVTAAEIAANAAISKLSERGYTRISTPIVERSELFLRRSGGVLASQMYEFTGPDGSRLSLRPEMTAPVIRYAIDQGDALDLPARFQYCGPVFRYPDPTLTGSDRPGNALRQFTQLGAELLGDPSPEADAEIISAAIDAAHAMGCQDIEVRLGHVGAVWRFVENLPLSRREQRFVANNLSLLEPEDNGVVPRRPRGLGMSDTARDTNSHQEYVDAISDAVSLTTAMGDPETAIATYEGQCARRDIQTDGLLDGFRRTCSLLADEGRPGARVSVDFALSAAVAYYTGMVVEVWVSDGAAAPVKVGGGGRYDGLATALGAAGPVPALGFALNLEDLQRCSGAAAGSDD